MIWFKKLSLAEIQKEFGHKQHLARFLEIDLIEIGDDFLRAKMPVSAKTHMPLGLLHGGASCVLAESLGSYASYFCIDPSLQRMVGLEINANHIASVREGSVVGTVRPLHLGRSTHVWDIRIEAADTQRLVCVSRLTVAVLTKEAANG